MAYTPAVTGEVPLISPDTSLDFLHDRSNHRRFDHVDDLAVIEGQDLGHDHADDLMPGIDPEVGRVGACPEIRVQDGFATVRTRHESQAEAQAVLPHVEDV